VPSFLTALFESGRVQVGPPDEGPTTSEMVAAAQIVVEQATVVALEVPGLSPTWSPAAASWAVVSLYRASQLAVFRLLDAGAIDELLAVPCPPGDPASRHWSVDSVFRF